MLCLYGTNCGKVTMPSAMARDNHAWPDDDGFVSVVAFDCLCIPVSDIRCSIGFYSELFAMRVVAGDAGSGRVVLGRGGRTRLALYAHSGVSGVPATRVAAVVESLDAARAVVWNNGLATLRDGVDGEGRDGRPSAFAIADPDGHEICFIERSTNGKRGYAS